MRPGHRLPVRTRTIHTTSNTTDTRTGTNSAFDFSNHVGKSWGCPRKNDADAMNSARHMRHR